MREPLERADARAPAPPASADRCARAHRDRDRSSARSRTSRAARSRSTLPGGDAAPLRRRAAGLDSTIHDRARSSAASRRAASSASASRTPPASGTRDDLVALFELLLRNAGRRGRAARARAAAARARPRLNRRNGLAARAAQHRLPLRPRQRPLRADARRDDDLLVRRLRARRTSRSPTRSGASTSGICEQLELGAGRPRARDRLRLGRLRAVRRRRARLPRHRPHDLARAGARSRASATRGPRRVEILEQDYRTHRGQLHEGRRRSRCSRRSASEQFGTYFATIDRAARAGRRRAASRRSSSRTSAGTATASAPDWIERYIFPGCLIPSLDGAHARDGAELAADGPRGRRDRRRTTPRRSRRWRASFHAQHRRGARARLRRRFERTWDFYLAFCEAAFRTRALRDAQLTLTRPFNEAIA